MGSFGSALGLKIDACIATLKKGASSISIPMMLGMSLCQLWVSLCFFLPQIFPEKTGYSVYDLSLVVTMVSLIPIFIWPKKCEQFLEKRSVIIGLTIIASIGSLLVPFSDYTTPSGAIIQYFAALFTGITTSWLFIFWFQLYCRSNDVAGYVLSILVSSVLMYALSVTGYMPEVNPWITVGITCALPFLSILCAHFSHPAEKHIQTYSFPPRASKEFQLLLTLCFSVFIISYVSEFSRNFYLNGSDLYFYASSINFVLLGAKIIAGIIIMVLVLQAQNQFATVFKVSFLLTMVAILFLPYAYHVSNLLYALTNFGAFLFKSIIFVICFNYCRHFRAAPILIVGLMRFVFSFDLFMGYNTYVVLVQSPFYSNYIIGIVSVCLGIAVMFTYLFVFTQQKTLAVESVVDVSELPVDTLRNRCEYLAQIGALTPRELEVLMLVAKGRTTPRIQEELSLSANTVNTHISHIYSKLKVHSRQELHDLVETVSPES